MTHPQHDFTPVLSVNIIFVLSNTMATTDETDQPFAPQEMGALRPCQQRQGS